MANDLTPALRNQLIDALLAVPGISKASTREALLANLPSNLIASLDVEGHPRVVVINIVTTLERVGRLTETGMRPLVVLAETAKMWVAGTDAGRALDEVLKGLETHYGGEPRLPPSPTLQRPVNTKTITIPEAIILKDQRVDYAFVEGALRVAASVARLEIPRIFSGQRDGESGKGTGWLIAPGLLLTNYHVIEARDLDHGEAPALEADLKAQGAATRVWFDYRAEAGGHVEHAASELLAWSGPDALDYALLRLRPPLPERRPLPIVRTMPALAQGARLNIVQHPNGGPVRFGIRRNYYVGTGDEPHFLRYLTDTEGGSSGSPVLNDAWLVLGLHHAAAEVQAQQHDGQTVFVNNEGIAIDKILQALPAALRDEIARAQSWQ